MNSYKIVFNDYLAHHGILGQRWGDRNGPPYPLDYDSHSKEEKKLAKKDAKWISKKEEKIKTKAFNKSEKEFRQYIKELNKRPDSYLSNGKISATYVNNYNRKLAELMNKNVGDIQAPSGKVVRFVAKRGEIGVFTALVDPGYDMNKIKNGLWNDARIGYKKDKVNILGGGTSKKYSDKDYAKYGITKIKNNQYIWKLPNGEEWKFSRINDEWIDNYIKVYGDAR